MLGAGFGILLPQVLEDTEAFVICLAFLAEDTCATRATEVAEAPPPPPPPAGTEPNPVLSGPAPNPVKAAEPNAVVADGTGGLDVGCGRS